MLAHLLFLGMPGVRLTRVWHDDAGVQCATQTWSRCARCPRCQRRSRHVHSHYHRTLADGPCLGQPVAIHLQVRRFRCRVRWCTQRIFTERLSALARPWAHRTDRQRASLARHALDLGGEGGARHCCAEGTTVSARTLLRLVRALSLPDAARVRILGVDDWSIRRGQRYGTILVNLETHTVIDLLPDRTAATLASWLQLHPEVTVISRDRAGAYAEGARHGAPQAIQIADRFHLDKNVTEALERYLLRHHRLLREAAQVLRTAPSPSEASRAPDELPAGTPVPATDDPLVAAPAAAASPSRRQARYAEVVALYAQGISIRAIVANKRPNPANYRMLYEPARGKRRLFRHDDPVHEYRNGKIVPVWHEIPAAYRPLLDWYHNEYDPQNGETMDVLVAPQAAEDVRDMTQTELIQEEIDTRFAAGV